MCLAVPARLTAISDKGDSLATAEFGGVQREISVIFVPSASVGDYVLVHAGCAIEVLDETDAEETLRLFAEISALQGPDENQADAWTGANDPEAATTPGKIPR